MRMQSGEIWRTSPSISAGASRRTLTEDHPSGARRSSAPKRSGRRRFAAGSWLQAALQRGATTTALVLPMGPTTIDARRNRDRRGRVVTAETAAFAAPAARAERTAQFRVVAGWLWSGAL